MAVTLELLGAFPILNSLPESTLTTIADNSSIRKFSRRGVVMAAGDIEESVCFLFEGRLQGIDFTIDGREVGLFFVEPGEFCGELGLFDDNPQSEYIIALTTAVVIFVPREVLKIAMKESAYMLSVLSSKLAARIRTMTYQRSLLALPSITQRVCCQLWMLVPEKHKSSERVLQNREDVSIINLPTHMEIAIMLSVSRETVTRVFQTLQKRQIVKRNGAGILIVNDLEELKGLAEGSLEL